MIRPLLALAALLTVWAAMPVSAQPIDDSSPYSAEDTHPLLPQDVLKSSATRFPDILVSIARERAARGDQLAAQGAFDLVFNADGFDRVSGFWTGAILNTELRQNLRPFGAQVVPDL